MASSAGNFSSLIHHPSLPSSSPFPSTQSSFLSIAPQSFRHHNPLTLHPQSTNRHLLYVSHSALPSIPPIYINDGGGGGSSGGGSGGGGGGGDNWNDNFFNFSNQNPFLVLPFHFEFAKGRDSLLLSLPKHLCLFLASVSASLAFFIFSSAEALARTDKEERLFEIKAGRRIELVPDYSKEDFITPESVWSWWSEDGKSKSLLKIGDIFMRCRELAANLLLPEGYPDTVSKDYLEHSVWRGVQGIAAQVTGVLATQALLYAVGLGKGAIPTAAALNWVLKDGIGYLSKIMLSKFGRHFDVNPKGWRLFADFLENAAFGLEILTPAFPHLFVQIGAVAGAGRSAATLIQAATRSCFYAGFAVQRNYAEVIAKGEAQGMVSKSIGIMIGIALANCVQNSTPLALASFSVVTWIHMFCNLKSYQAIKIRTLNPFRASLVFSQYLLSGLVPSVNEVNDAEPFFPAFPNLTVKRTSIEQTDLLLTTDAKTAAFEIDQRLRIGSALSDVVENRQEATSLCSLYQSEGYILTELRGGYCVVLKEGSTPRDMLKSLFQVCYLYWLEKNGGIKAGKVHEDCKPGGRLRISLEYVDREFNHAKNDSEAAGWLADGLVARPLPNRIRICNEEGTS